MCPLKMQGITEDISACFLEGLNHCGDYFQSQYFSDLQNKLLKFQSKIEKGPLRAL